MKSILIALVAFVAFVLISSKTTSNSNDKISKFDLWIEGVRKSLGYRAMLVFIYIHMAVLLIIHGSSH